MICSSASTRASKWLRTRIVLYNSWRSELALLGEEIHPGEGQQVASVSVDVALTVPRCSPHLLPRTTVELSAPLGFFADVPDCVHMSFASLVVLCPPFIGVASGWRCVCMCPVPSSAETRLRCRGRPAETEHGRAGQADAPQAQRSTERSANPNGKCLKRTVKV